MGRLNSENICYSFVQNTDSFASYAEKTKDLKHETVTLLVPHTDVKLNLSLDVKNTDSPAESF
jgi:hypothetical protein